MMTAPFIAFEGIDKCGKGTQHRLAAHELSRAWGDCVHFSEPNDGSPIGQLIRRILKGELPMPPIEKFQRLYVFERSIDTTCTVLPALKRGVPVVAERFALSTIAYGSLKGTVEDYVRMHEEVLGPWLRWPDITILLDIPAEAALQRLAAEHGTPELFEKLEPLTKIRNAYLRLAKESRRWAPQMSFVVIDGNRSYDEVTCDVMAALRPYFR